MTCAGIAAQLAYYFFLSLFPALLFLVALASFFPLYSFTDELMRLLGADRSASSGDAAARSVDEPLEQRTTPAC